jgi:hypothetical protein
LTIAQLVAKHGVHQTLIHGWKKQALKGVAGVSSAKRRWPAMPSQDALLQSFDLSAEVVKLLDDPVAPSDPPNPSGSFRPGASTELILR